MCIDVTDHLRGVNVSKSKSAGDLIAELKAHSGVASLRKVGRTATGSSDMSSAAGSHVDQGPEQREFQLVMLRHVNVDLS